MKGKYDWINWLIIFFLALVGVWWLAVIIAILMVYESNERGNSK